MSTDLFARVKEIPLEQVIREYFPSVELKRSGRDLVSARCPLHDESTPSFHVYVEQNRWHCFGACGAGGSSIDLLMRAGVEPTALDAAKALATKFSIDIRESKRKNLTVSDYGDFCALPADFLRQVFDLGSSDAGVEIPYKDEGGAVVSVQRRHKLEKGKRKDNRFSWRKGDKILPYGLWMLLPASNRLTIVEGPSDVHVLTHCGIAALGIPGASNFKPEMVSHLLPFNELALIQEPGEGGEKFIQSITKALKNADYKGVVRAVTLPEKDPRALWLTSRDKTQFVAALEQAFAAAAPIDLYPIVPLTAKFLREMAVMIRRFVFFKNERVPLLIATWILATYIHAHFQYFAVLWVSSPVMRCGKSRLLEIIDKLAWKSSGLTIGISPAALFRLTSEGCTLLADEMENLKNSDREQFGAIMGIINAGFAAGATVPRAEKGENGWIVRRYPVYGPKVIAGISTVTDTIRDRSLSVKMVRKSPRERTARLSIRKEGKAFDALRASMALWAEQNAEAVEEIYGNMTDEPALEGCDDRFLDIVEPLLSILRFADAESTNGGKRIQDELLPLFKQLGGQRVEAQAEESITALCGLLDGILEGQTEAQAALLDPEGGMFVASADLLEKMKQTTGLQWIGSTKSMATFLSKLDLVSRRDPAGKLRGYLLTKEILEDIKLRYMPSIPEFEASEVSESQSGRGPEDNL
jgi:hypothetical protein